MRMRNLYTHILLCTLSAVAFTVEEQTNLDESYSRREVRTQRLLKLRRPENDSQDELTI